MTNFNFVALKMVVVESSIFNDNLPRNFGVCEFNVETHH